MMWVSLQKKNPKRASKIIKKLYNWIVINISKVVFILCKTVCNLL